MSPLPLHDSFRSLPLPKKKHAGKRPKKRLEALLADLGPQLRRGDSLGSRDREQPPRCSTGIEEIDRLLGGGFPRGRLSEISGSPSSGRTSLALSLLAATTQSGELAAVVDRADAFDPLSAARAGVNLERVLWARALTWRETLRCTEHLLETDGFPLVLLDLTADLGGAPRRGEYGPTATWIRLARLATSTRTTVVLLSAERLAGPHAEIALEMQPARARFTGTPALLEELEIRAVLVRHRTSPGDARGQCLRFSILRPNHLAAPVACKPEHRESQALSPCSQEGEWGDGGGE